jgi:pyruvate/2-oxoacid:ferredoxin oxidoreductase beta subunit
MAVETGLVVLYEIEDNIFRLTAASESLARKGGNLQPVREYFKSQGRFKTITEEQIDELQQWVNARWKQCLNRATNL